VWWGEHTPLFARCKPGSAISNTHLANAARPPLKPGVCLLQKMTDRRQKTGRLIGHQSCASRCNAGGDVADKEWAKLSDVT